MSTRVRSHSMIAALTAAMLMGSPVMAATDLPGPTVPVTATVSSSLRFDVTIVELIPKVGGGGTTIGPVVTAMDFGTLASNGTFGTPPQLRALNSLKAFQVFFGVNAQQRAFSIKQTAGPLQSGGNTIPNGAFIVTPLDGIGGDPTKPLPSNITKGTRTSAVGTNIVLFNAGTGSSATMAATYGITDDPALGATQPIPIDQPTGTYTTNITYTATVI